MEHEMVVVDGIRYRIEDAKRLGLVKEPDEKRVAKAPNKARTSASDKSTK